MLQSQSLFTNSSNTAGSSSSATNGPTADKNDIKWSKDDNDNSVNNDDDAAAGPSLKEQLQREQESREELEQKIRALESQTPVMKKLTSFVSTQRALERENKELRQQLEELKNQQQQQQPPKGTSNDTATAVADGGFTEDEVNKILDEEQEKREKQLQALREEHSVKVTSLQEELKALQEKLQQQQQNTTAGNTANNNNSTDVDVLQLQAELKAVRAGHATEMDEILQQLDLVESEHRQELERVKSFADEQQAMVTALSHELASKEHKNNTNNHATTTTNNLEELQYLQQQVSNATANAQHWEEKCREVKSHYKQLLEEERQHTLQEADRARHETIQEAEAQFQQANELYMTLKQEYGRCQHDKHQLQQELDATQDEIEQLQRERQTMERDFQQQMEDLQQELERVQSAGVHDKQHFNDQLHRFQQTHDDLVEELEQAKQQYHALEKTYATTIMAKEQLARENADLKGVCEESMALLEQYNIQQQGQEEIVVAEGEIEGTETSEC